MSTLLVEICEINSVQECPNADRLDIVTVKGWQCIVSKNVHKVGDRVVYAPIDSMIPQTLSDSMEVTGYLGKTGRVKTVKMRGTYSQGLIIPLTYLPESWQNKPVGTNVADILGIIKYEKPPDQESTKTSNPKKKSSSRTGDTAPNHPDFHIYTDIENIKNFPDVLEENELVHITEKIHGTNFRAMKTLDNKFLVGSHRRVLYPTFAFNNPRYRIYPKDSNTDIMMTLFEQDIIGVDNKIMKWLCNNKFTKKIARRMIINYPPSVFRVKGTNYGIAEDYSRDKIINLLLDLKMISDCTVYWKIAHKYNLKNILRPGQCLYGEIYGKKIQVLDYDMEDIDVAFFDLKEVKVLKEYDATEYVNMDEFIEFTTLYNLPTVPLLKRSVPWNKDLMKLADQKSSIAKHTREGIVIRPVKERNNRNLGRVIVKHISEKYLAKEFEDIEES